MHRELLARLKELDRTGGSEEPRGFDYRAALREILSHKSVLEELLGCSLKTDVTQDASYIADFFVQDTRYANMKVGDLIATQIVQIVCIRFSAFDRMFTVFGTELQRFSELTPTAIKYLLEHEFKYVSEEDLMTPYEGIDGRSSEGYTWFARFFDYV